MDDLVRQLISTARAMWLRRWVGLAVAWVCAMVGAVVVLRMPERYEATSRIFVDTQSVLKPLLAGLAIQPDANQQVSMLARTLITRPNIEKLIRSTDVSLIVKNDADREVLIDYLLREIRLSGGGRENLYNVSYRDTNMARAREVVQTLTNMFVESGLGSRKKDTEIARRFIDEQIKTYEKKLEEAENRLKEFKLRNLSYTTGSGKDFFGQMTTINEDLAKVRLELRAAGESRDALKRQLAGEEPILMTAPTPNAGGVESVPETDTRLEVLRRQLDDQLRKYTDEHPDVLGTRRLIAQLEEQRNKEVEARRRTAGASNRGVSTATNPVFQRIKISLADAEANVASLQARRSELEGRLAQLRSQAGRVPQIDAELAQLNRDYDILRRNYDGLVSRRESASISEDVDATTQLADFRVIDPPRVSPTAVFPNRAALVIMALLAALGAGAAASFVVSQLFPTIDSTHALREIGKRPVLGIISMQESPASIKKHRVANFAFGSAVSVLIAAYGAWFAWVNVVSRM
jgi:polysaccharide chain length determinant protein (PEP-CTERM system associated)